MALPQPEEKVWTYEDYRQLPDDGNRYEIIDGRLYVTPSPSMIHQALSRRLKFVFYRLEQEGQGYIINAPADLLMPGADPVQPDLMFLTVEQRQQIRKHAVVGPPTLIVEILSPGTARVDRTVKLRKYAQCGVPHYWLLDAMSTTLEAFRLGPDGHYVVTASLGPGERYESEAFPGVVVDMDSLFADLPGGGETAEE